MEIPAGWMGEQVHSHRIHGTGIFTYIWLIFMVHVGKYTIHGSYGIQKQVLPSTNRRPQRISQLKKKLPAHSDIIFANSVCLGTNHAEDPGMMDMLAV